MNRKWHFIISLFFFVTLMLLFKVVTVTLIVIPLAWGTLVPDADKSFESHRNIWFHSLVIPLIVMIFNLGILTILIVLSTGLHCLCDIGLKKKGGFFTIKWVKMKSIDGFWFAEVWLICNFIVAVVLFILYMVYA